MSELAEDFRLIEELLVRLTILRRHPRHRQILVQGTGLDGRITTMRLLRAVSDVSRTGTPSIREVAERLIMEHSNASRAVDQAVDQGLLTKRQSAADGRRSELELTPKGRQAVRELDARRAAVYAELGEGWEPEELAALAALLGKLCTSYETLHEDQH